MKFSNIKAVAIKNLHQIKRDPRMIGLSIIAPIIVTALFGFAFGGDLTNLKVYVLDNDENFNNIFANEILNKIYDDPRIKFNTSTSNPNLVKQAVDNNYSQAAFIFPYTFTQNILLGIESEVELYVSYANPNASNHIINAFQASLDNVMRVYFGQSRVVITITPVYQGKLGPIPPILNISLSNLDVGWSALHDELSNVVFDFLDEDETVNLEKVRSSKKYEDKVRNGEARAIIKFPEEFTYNILIKREIELGIKLDGADPMAASAIIGALTSSLSDTFEEEFDISVFDIDEYYYNNPDGKDEAVDSITYFTPAIIGFIVFFFAFLLTMLSFLRERKQGTMERILTSPINRTEIILGYILSYSIISLIQSTVVFFSAIFIFNAQIEFSWLNLLQAYLIVYLLLLAALGTGIFLSTLAKSEFQIIQFIPLVILPFMLLSGVWAPIETLPDWLRPASSFIPLTYANNGMRSILIRGQSIHNVIIEIGILAAFASLMIFLGIVSLNKKLK